ncbi:MAG: histidine kinase dimerization/phospho-acceptor domain-containing protein [bacterium]
MARRVPRTSVPIVLGTIAVPLTVAILVGWTIVVARSPFVTGAWLLVLGIISLSIILLVLVLLSLFLLREMVAAQRQFGFIDSVTHELKSPLASVKLGLDALRRPDLPPEKTQEVVEMVRTEVDRLSGFIGDVLQARPGGARPEPAGRDDRPGRHGGDDRRDGGASAPHPARGHRGGRARGSSALDRPHRRRDGAHQPHRQRREVLRSAHRGAGGGPARRPRADDHRRHRPRHRPRARRPAPRLWSLLPGRE